MTSVSKNVYIGKLDDIVSEYNNTYHRTIKMKSVDVEYNTYINLKKEVNDKDPKFKVGNHVRILSTKIFLQKDTCEASLKKFLLFVKLKIQFHGHMLLTISMVKKLLEHFVKKDYKRLIKKSSG